MHDSLFTCTMLTFQKLFSCILYALLLFCFTLAFRLWLTCASDAFRTIYSQLTMTIMMLRTLTFSESHQTWREMRMRMKVMISYLCSLSSLLLMRCLRRVQLTIKKRKRRKQTLLMYLALKIQLTCEWVTWTSQTVRRRRELRIFRQSLYLFLTLHLLSSLSVNCQHCLLFLSLTAAFSLSLFSLLLTAALFCSLSCQSWFLLSAVLCSASHTSNTMWLQCLTALILLFQMRLTRWMNWEVRILMWRLHLLCT